MESAFLATEVIAQRVFNPLYIYLDIVFLLFLIGLLLWKKHYLTVIFGLFGGVLYMIVDYGIFHLATHSRFIEGGNLFWVLLWMSMSYGITNFVWIWLRLVDCGAHARFHLRAKSRAHQNLADDGGVSRLHGAHFGTRILCGDRV